MAVQRNVTNPPRRQAGQARPGVRKPLNLRIKPEVRSLIDYAAELTGKNLTDFVLDAARLAAQHALLDRAVIPMDKKAYKAFVDMLAVSPNPDARLVKTMQTPPVWK